jgi:hypothetical protein
MTAPFQGGLEPERRAPDKGRSLRADVAEPVDAADLKSASLGSAGSSPAVRTRGFTGFARPGRATLG